MLEFIVIFLWNWSLAPLSGKSKKADFAFGIVMTLSDSSKQCAAPVE